MTSIIFDYGDFVRRLSGIGETAVGLVGCTPGLTTVSGLLLAELHYISNEQKINPHLKL
jgi:hypothetical protein